MQNSLVNINIAVDGITEPQSSLIYNPRPLNLFMAGKGSGKTHIAGVISALYTQKHPHVKGFIGANTDAQLNTSTFTRIVDVWEKFFGFKEYTGKECNEPIMYTINKKPPQNWTVYHKFKSHDNIVSFNNGAIIFLASLENAKAHEGKEFGWAILDETKDSREHDVKDTILSRLRQDGVLNADGANIRPMFVLTSPAKVQWLNDMFGLATHRADIERCIALQDKDYFSFRNDRFNIVISSTHHNQKNLPSDYISVMEQTNTTEKIQQIVYGNPFCKSGAEYIYTFDNRRHVGNFIYDPNKALHITFDFNLLPYNTCLVFQIEKVIDKYNVDGIDELCIKPPNNSPFDVCDAIMRKYGQHKAGLFIYGDATGRARNIAYKEFKHHYDVIKYKLHTLLNNQSNRVPKSNPPNVKRRDMMNLIFEEKTIINLRFDSRMKHTIEDCMYCMADDRDGGKDKHRVKDEDTGENYEKYGHCLDATEYMIFECFKKLVT